MMHDLITLCFTIGKRPNLLRRTLESLGDLRNMPTLAVNDFGDPESSAVFTEMCPNGRIVGLGYHVGHHPAVDSMYAEVTTPFIFHNEDDWGFERTDFLPDAMRLLEAEPALSQVCFRHSTDMVLTPKDRAKIITETREGIKYERLDPLHRQWHGYTFNPHLIARAEWERLGGYSQFAKERHISRCLRSQGRHSAFFIPASCHHIGDQQSTVPRKITAFKKFKNWLRGRS